MKFSPEKRFQKKKNGFITVIVVVTEQYQTIDESCNKIIDSSILREII